MKRSLPVDLSLVLSLATVLGMAMAVAGRWPAHELLGGVDLFHLRVEVVSAARGEFRGILVVLRARLLQAAPPVRELLLVERPVSLETLEPGDRQRAQLVALHRTALVQHRLRQVVELGREFLRWVATVAAADHFLGEPLVRIGAQRDIGGCDRLRSGRGGGTR